jgi:type I restriction enzyme S subunit
VGNSFCNFVHLHYAINKLANIRENGIIDDVETYEGIDLPTRARRKIKEGQVIVSSIEGSLSSCALVTKDFNGAICTNGFYVVDADEINSETLLVLIRLEPLITENILVLHDLS